MKDTQMVDWYMPCFLYMISITLIMPDCSYSPLANIGAEVVARRGVRPGWACTVDPVSVVIFWKLCWNDAWYMEEPFITLESASGRSRALAKADTWGALDSVLTTASTSERGLSDPTWNYKDKVYMNIYKNLFFHALWNDIKKTLHPPPLSSRENTDLKM